ncbi:MAG: DUF6231 family protein [Pseudomonadota bacterium]
MEAARVQVLWQHCFGNTDGADDVAELGPNESPTDGAVVVAASYDALDDDAAVQALGQLTSRLVPQIVWLRPEPASQRLQAELLALGFEPAGAFADRFAYSYDISRANQPREWNTPENWANPSQFNKRW